MVEYFPTYQDIKAGQTNFEPYMPPALPGMINGMGTFITLPFTNNISASDTWTFTPPATVSASTKYTMTASGNTVEFTTDSSATAAELMAGLYAAARSDAQFWSDVDITLDSGTNVITVLARGVGQKLAASSTPTATNPIVVANTVPSSIGSVIPFGRFVGRKASYWADPLDNAGPASLINHASDFTVLGVTMSSNAVEKTGRFGDAVQSGYPVGSWMDVMIDTGTIKGIWVECVEPDIAPSDTACIAIAAGNEGKLTKSASGTINVGTKVRIMNNCQQAFGKNIVLVNLAFRQK